jgi:hypothetical protein
VDYTSTIIGIASLLVGLVSLWVGRRERSKGRLALTQARSILVDLRDLLDAKKTIDRIDRARSREELRDILIPLREDLERRMRRIALLVGDDRSARQALMWFAENANIEDRTCIESAQRRKIGWNEQDKAMFRRVLPRLEGENSDVQASR